MEAGMTVMSRQALFEAAWQRPLTDIAAEFGISDVGLRKICDRHDIPTPGRGYWAQVRAGKTFTRPKLRPVSDPRKKEVHIAGGRPLSPVVVDAMKQAKAVSARPRSSRVKQATIAEVDPISPSDQPPQTGTAATSPPTVGKALAGTGKALAKARMDADGFSSVSGSGVVPMRIAPSSYAAALDFLAMFLREADVRGWRLEAEEGRPKLKIEGETIAFRIDEVADKTPHSPTPKELAEKARRDRWGGNSHPAAAGKRRCLKSLFRPENSLIRITAPHSQRSRNRF